MTRQTGEAVCWRGRKGQQVNFYDGADESVVCTPRIFGFEIEPLIPASDLSTLTRERDEAVRLLRGYVADYPPFELDHMTEAFLATVEDKP